MKNYDNYFLPVDNMEEAKRYYEEILGLKKKFKISEKSCWQKESDVVI